MSFKFGKKLLAGAAAVSLSLGATACGGGDDLSWSVKVGDRTASIGTYIYYLMGSYESAMNYMESEDDDLFSLTIEGKPAEEWMRDRAIQSAKGQLVILDKWEEMGYDIEDSRSNIDNYAKTLWGQTQSIYELNGVSYESFYTVIENNYISQELFKKLYGEGGEREVKDDDIMKYLDDTYASAMIISMPLTDDEGNTLGDDEISALRSMADDYVSSAKSSDAFLKSIHEYEKYSGTYTEPEEGEEDSALNYAALLYREMVGLPANIVTDVFDSMKAGEARSFEEDGKSIYVVYKMDMAERTDIIEDYRDSLLREMRGEEFTAMIDGWTDAAAAEINTPAIEKYRPTRFKFE